ncbi:hypothetical protein V5799_018558 [Amblyomma americanum]|uniref:Peptidase M13 C-terminal domain-containing protein n=1 Tax=Amblyomma americanum TaxID=6943 RepID=A0AAQ4EZF6_AMBAM
MLLLLVESTSSAYFQHCDNPVSCFDLDTELQRSRHVDVDPCRNMFGHVCGRWTSMYPGRQDQFELLNQRLIMSLLENVGQVSTGSGSATDKAGAALFGCMRVAEDMVDDISAIREVLNRHGLHLPAQDIRPSRDVFRILVGLTLQDLLGVFFQLKPSPYLRTDDSLQLKNILQDETINYANTVSKRVRQQIEMSYNLSMLDPQSAKSIMQRLRSIHQIVGTASKLRSDAALNSYYRHIPKYDAKVNFVKWLVKAHRAEAAHKILFLHPSPDIATSINRDDWEPTSISVGAFYVILYHLIYLPGSTLVSPLLVRNGPNSYNYGAIGKVIGHELSHAFEPRFLEVTTRGDAQASYTPRFRKLLEGQQECLILQANKMTESAIAGNNSISETYADTAGLEAAYLAYSTLPLTDRRMGVGPYTADQAFFVGSCYMFCEAERTPSERSVYLPHRVRCNQPCINIQEFADAYRCSKGSAMFPRSRCDIHDHRLINPSEAR